MDDIRSFCPLWGEWEADEKLGEGSFGAVWRIRREGFGGQTYYAAVKHISIPKDESEIRSLMDEGILDSRESAVRYYNKMLDSLVGEIDTMHQLQGYTNIVSYEDHKIIPKKQGIGYDLFLRMEMLTPLTKRIREQMTVSDVIRLGCDIAEAISILNKFHLVHRDIKPQNIFVNNTGDYKLGDYGTARALHSEATAMSRKGTFNYMAPEIYNNQPADIRVDVYSLGIVLYRLLNGNRLPFLPTTGEVTNRMNEEAQVRRLSGEALPPPAYATGDLARVVLKACAFRPEERYQSAEKMKKDLQQCLDERNHSLMEGRMEQSPSEPLQFKYTRTNTGTASSDPSRSESSLDKTIPGAMPASVGTAFEEEASVTVPVIIPSPEPQPKPAVAAQTGAPSSDKKKGKALWIILAAIVLVAAAVVILLVNGRGKTDNQPPDSETVPAAVEQKTAEITEALTTAPAEATEEPTAAPETVTEAPTVVPEAVANAPTAIPEAATEAPVVTPETVTEAPTIVPEAVTNAPTATPEPKKPQGDVNGDGVLDMSDAELLGRYVSGWDVKLDENEADINGDGTVDLSDVVRLQKELRKNE